MLYAAAAIGCGLWFPITGKREGLMRRQHCQEKRIIVTTLQLVLISSMAIALARAQAKPPLAEDVFKNIQVLRGIPVDEFMNTMGFFAASLSLNCTSCHGLESAGDVARFADDTPLKQTARKMILMVRAINQSNFAGKRMVTCYTCHRGGEQPEITPSLAEQYGSPPPEDPDRAELLGGESERTSVDAILDRYLRALGGVQQLAKLTGFVAKGTYEGYDTDREKVPVEVFAKAPDQRAMMVHLPDGDKVTTYDGRDAWIAEPNTPMPLMALTGGNLDGARLDAILPFPAALKQSRSQWLAGTAAIDDRGVEIIEGVGTGQLPLKLYFDKGSHLLVRMVRYADTLVGLVPTQVDYSDYRQISGVMLPFKWTVTWVDGQSTTELSEVQPNVPIDPAKFAKPATAGKSTGP
jgi:photosynthetic reaction center cytochrome c subunit